MLLRNYYSSLSASFVGNTKISEDVSHELSPRYSRTYDGNYVLCGFPLNIINTLLTPSFYYGNYYSLAYRAVIFGNNTNDVTFDDYWATGNGTALSSIRTSNQTTYDSNTKTYTSIETFTLTNNSEVSLTCNEILIGGSGFSVTAITQQDRCIALTRDLLGENSFTIEPKESVKFELTIKYTIAEPLQ